MKKIIICLLCLVLLCGCKSQNLTQENKMTVVTTIFPLYDFACAVGGDCIDVKMLIRPGSECILMTRCLQI